LNTRRGKARKVELVRGACGKGESDEGEVQGEEEQEEEEEVDEDEEEEEEEEWEEESEQSTHSEDGEEGEDEQYEREVDFGILEFGFRFITDTLQVLARLAVCDLWAAHLVCMVFIHAHACHHVPEYIQWPLPSRRTRQACAYAHTHTRIVYASGHTGYTCTCTVYRLLVCAE
jgi:hypothetical protein